ncbi:hypothetical protein, partial [Candidatus Venteria ishoeyi]|uniref:hypothetical protein n=1 Tax=Candidatus Venteria ishoeyi TaxID=1899563 RepID=UPI0015AF7B98
AQNLEHPLLLVQQQPKVDLRLSTKNGKDDIADIKNTQSIRVIEISPRFINANNAMNIVINPETPIGHAPTPALSCSCARNTTKVVVPQITQENT